MSTDHESVTEQELVQRARASVNEHTLDDKVKRRLQMARTDAVAQVNEKHSLSDSLFGGNRWLIPSGVSAAVAVALVLVLSNTEPTMTMPLLNEQELAAAADMELLDDMEFLAWMLEEETLDEG